MSVWSFFNTILYINLDERVDRLIQIHQELQRVGIEDAIRIPGVLNDDRPLGFNQAQRNALEAAKGVTLILEDDVIFSGISHLEHALYELPEDWDILYFGGNVVGTDLCSWPEPEYYSENLRRVNQCWTTHAVAYSEKCVKWILENWNHKEGMYDDFLRQKLEVLNGFIVFPMVANQRAGYSDIWRRDVDYGFFNVWRQNK